MNDRNLGYTSEVKYWNTGVVKQWLKGGIKGGIIR
jgi:hypothetical protein